ncbi:AAA family ATPase [Tumebacillus flagellatus]|uniref:AAA+ ATPase domain-containing protein n=1 Tax=Tumebacillus flagellatus TaxID=1157490 RepID=A0A074LXM3_9BACL|nr:AAA family ATPase [Tumebacillus flagellatus]KEO84868.1 hypothetical protein EL26_02335 [Tumebacillus flagellatus]
MAETRIPEAIRNAFASVDLQNQQIALDFLEHLLSMGFSCEYVKNYGVFVFTYNQFEVCQILWDYLNGFSKIPGYLMFLAPTPIKEKVCSETLFPIKEQPLIRKLVEAKEFHHSYNATLGDLDLLIPFFEQIRDAFFRTEITVDFRIESLELTNFRCYKSETFTFNPQSTVLIGKNASGKTSLLEGITVAIGGFLRAIDEKVDKRAFEASDVRFTSKWVQNAPATEHHPPTEMKVTSRLINNRLVWSRSRTLYESDKNSRTTYKESNEITSIVKQLVSDVRDEKNSRQIILPVFAYHGTGRVANFNRDMGEVGKTEKISRFFAYKDCLKPNSNYKTFIAWYRKMKYLAFEINQQIPVLDAVTDLLVRGLRLLTEDEEHFVEGLFYFEGELHLKYEDGTFYPISTLSDGYQDIIGILSDIAFRMAVLNPQLGTEVSAKTPGIVLIDEVDLHLHPKWQQKVLYVLKTLFPKVQFISTTHSPVIISATEKDEAFELYQEEDTILTKPIGNPAEWYLSDILAQAFHVSSKPPARTANSISESLEELLHRFSELVKTAVPTPSDEQKREIEVLYERLLPSLPIDSPRRKAVDALKGLVK